MTDYIDRQAAIKAIDDLPNCYNGYSDAYDKACIIGVLEELPPAEVEPVKRGRWEPHPSEREWDTCSYCHLGTKRREYGLNDDGTEWVTEQSYTRCPWCGAKMENE